jgi:hypothetical protein
MIEADIDAFLFHKIDAYLLRQADAYLRVVAPTECPHWSACLVVTYDELEIDAAVDGEDSRGLSVRGMDRFAAWLRQDDTLVGRPVFALATGRVPPTLGGLVELRRTSLHELAHAVLDRQADRDFNFDPPAYRPWLHERVRSARPTFGSKRGHGPDWWRVFMTLVARGETIASRLMPIETVEPWVSMYGYSAAGNARQWVDAAKSDPDYLDLPLVELPARNTPAFDELLARLPQTMPDIPSGVAATIGA